MSDQNTESEVVVGPDWSEVQPTATVISSVEVWAAAQTSETAMGRDNRVTTDLIHGYWNTGTRAVGVAVEVDVESVA